MATLVALAGPATAVPAFPGAEGYGANATGGRGGRVIEVTNLNDSGPGSLRAACEAEGPRIVVFRVSGTIALESRLRIRNGDLTIAGQTAPGGGICLKNYGTDVSDTRNVIIRYLRFRPGDEMGIELDALGGRYSEDIIIDHCSASWCIDECVSFYANRNITIQWCLMSESLWESHHVKGAHGYGGIWGGERASLHHNLFAHHTSRNPRFASHSETDDDRPFSGGRDIDYRNNVIYNWGFNSAYGGEGATVNMIANYYKYGPGTREDKRNRIIQPSDDKGRWYVADNFVFGFPEITADNWAGGVQGENVKPAIRARRPLAAAPVTTHSAEEAYRLVLANVGATLPKRDSHDARIIEEVRTGTAKYGETWEGGGKGIINSQTAVGGWPVLTSAPPPVDSDHDGMPDYWEDDRDLDPNDPSDGPKDRNDDGYSNVEEYINSLVPSRLAGGPLAFPGAEGYGRFARGGRGGDVYHVTNLDDSGPGSLREGIDSADGPRTIVFDVSGTIDLESKLRIEKSNITIAGQTAPGDGITLKDHTLNVNRASDLIIRYIRVRLGDQDEEKGGADTMTTDNIDNVIIDHVSASWAIDGTHDFRNGKNFTIQWSILSEALHDSIHGKGPHAMCASYRAPVGNITLHHNIFATSRDRHPSLGGADEPQWTVDFRNNVIYNWSGTANFGDNLINAIDNYFKPGPETDVNRKPIAIKGHLVDAARGYMSGNFFDGREDWTRDNYAALDFERWRGPDSSYKYAGTLADWKVADPPDLGPNTPATQSAQEAYELVLSRAGCSLKRDAVDVRVIDDIRNRTGKLIDSQDEVGGWPELKSKPAPVDTDEDGMPDAWEKAHGLNPKDASDGPKDRDGDGYTNLEEYLNSLVPPMAPASGAAGEKSMSDSDSQVEQVFQLVAEELGVARKEARELVHKHLCKGTCEWYRTKAEQRDFKRQDVRQEQRRAIEGAIARAMPGVDTDTALGRIHKVICGR